MIPAPFVSDALHYQAVEKRHERSEDKAKFDEKAQFMCNK